MKQRIAYFEYGQVYPPLVNGNPPAVPEPAAAPHTSPRGLQAAALLLAIVSGAWLIRFWIGDDIPAVLQRVAAPFSTAVWAVPCVGAWLLLCVLAVVRAWRNRQ
jgi:hypothetical protein